MKILSVDSSASMASVCITDNGKIISDFYINTKLTHSQTLVSMINDALKNSKTDINSIDCFAVNAGPGSFTGIRIGVSAVKGMAMALNKPCVAVSTLECMAQSFLLSEGSIICCVMDARCSQVYNALFCIKNGCAVRLCDDRALPIADLLSELDIRSEQVLFAGDGSELCYNSILEKNDRYILPPQNVRYQRASAVAYMAQMMIDSDNIVSSAALMPKYLRLPQAQRELNKKLSEEN